MTHAPPSSSVNSTNLVNFLAPRWKYSVLVLTSFKWRWNSFEQSLRASLRTTPHPCVHLWSQTADIPWLSKSYQPLAADQCPGLGPNLVATFQPHITRNLSPKYCFLCNVFSYVADMSEILLYASFRYDCSHHISSFLFDFHNHNASGKKLSSPSDRESRIIFKWPKDKKGVEKANKHYTIIG